MWEPESPRNRGLDVLLDTGPICSVAVSGQGDVVFGGYGPDVGIQVWRSGEWARRLDETMEDLYYHSVDISPDGKEVYGISHGIRSPDGQGKNALLRAWPLSEETKELTTPRLVHKPVQAVAFLPEKRLLLIEASRIIQRWNLP